nr:ParB-like nuclease domain-containing protein [Spirochaetota bacterium]
MKEKMQSIKDKIIKTEKVEWKKLKPLQGDNLKEFSQENYEKLKNSLLNNSFIDPLNVWESKGEIYILDGHHRVKMFFNLEKEGVSVPEKLTANFIDCKNKKEAAKVLLLACADYAKVKDKGLYDFLSVNELNFEDIKFEMDIPTISFSKFEDSFYKDEKTQKEEKLNEVPEV